MRPDPYFKHAADLFFVVVTLQDFNYKHMNFRLKVAEDMWNDEARTKVTIFKVEPVSPAKDGWVSAHLPTSRIACPQLQVLLQFNYGAC